MLKILERTRKLGELKQFKRLPLRFLSNDVECLEKVNDKPTNQKSFSKSLSAKLGKHCNENFVNDLFRGQFDKNIFEYPTVIDDRKVDSILTHSVEVENYLNNSSNQNCDITKTTLKDLQNLKLLGLSVPQKYGGLGYNQTETKFIIECAGVNHKVARFLCQNEDFVMKVLTLYGTEEQKQMYLPKIIAGEIFVTFAYLEEGPLIDMSSFQISAIFDEQSNAFIINGSKKWVYNAHISDFIILLTRSTEFNYEIEHKFSIFIVDKNSPGLTVHELKSRCAKEFGLYEVDFNRVSVPKNNLIGKEECGYDILKTCFSYYEFGSAAICSSVIKRLNYSVTEFCEGKMSDKLKEHHSHVKANIGMLTAYTYALESVIYMVSGRFDTYENSDLFVEAILTKVFAVEILQHAIQKYIQVVGSECFKWPGLLDEALEIMKYYSIFNENNLYLKLIIGSGGLLHASNQISESIRKLRNPDDNLFHHLKNFFKGQEEKETELKLNLKLKEELHMSLCDKADFLESAVAKLQLAVETHLVNSGSSALDNEIKISQIAEMAVYIYALTACLARASNSYCNYVQNSEHEISITHIFGDFAYSKVEHLLDQISRTNYSSLLYKRVGKETFTSKMYPVQHPLMRTY